MEIEILEVCKIPPSPSPTADFSLPLTFFDLLLLQSSPFDTILFYSLAADGPNFNSILQRLKNSLSLTLSHFLPLAGNLVWPHHSPEPFILYKQGDAVSLTIAQANHAAHYNTLSSDHVRKANESRFLVPKYDTSSLSDTVVPAMCVQITLFLNRGFSIGVTTSHVVADGTTATMFLKSWASICSLNLNYLEHAPDFDRTAAKDPTGLLQKLYSQIFRVFLPNNHSLRLPPREALSNEVVRGRFRLTSSDIESLRERAAGRTLRHLLTTFVLTFAHVSTCLIKAQLMQSKNFQMRNQMHPKIGLVFVVDWRALVGSNSYFGNSVSEYPLFMEVGEFEEENAMEMVAKKISDGIGEIKEKVKENRVAEMLEFNLVRWRNQMRVAQTITVAWSPRFGIYDVDFGWGGCEKLEINPVTPGEHLHFSMADCKNNNGNVGGVEVGVALPSEAMNFFCSLFSEGVNVIK